MSTQTTLVTLKSIPEGIPNVDDFEIIESIIRSPEQGEFLAETIYLALDPYIRVTMVGRHFFSTPGIGDVPRGSTISRVISSKHDSFKEGDLVVMESGMQSHAISDGHDVHHVDTGSAPITTALGILGMPGFTAYSALLGPAQLKEDDVVLVSAASGAVGSMVGQIASIKNANVFTVKAWAMIWGFIKTHTLNLERLLTTCGERSDWLLIQECITRVGAETKRLNFLKRMQPKQSKTL